MFKVAEHFISINGEGPRAGQLALFIRFAGCNLNCSYCDTRYASEPGASYEEMSEKEILDLVTDSGIADVTLTGGEPLYRPDIYELIRDMVVIPGISVEIETNGSVDISPYDDMPLRPAMTLDYKLPGSGMEEYMNTGNYSHLCRQDTVKFVCSDMKDLEKAREIIREYELTGKCHVYLSPVFGKIDPADMVEYMKDHRMNGVNLQLQLHKIIWNPEKRGV